jgi:hypothetical protein
MKDKRYWISNKRAIFTPALVEKVELDLLPGVLHVPRMRDTCWLYLGSISGNSGYGQVEYRVGDHPNICCKMGIHVLMLRHHKLEDCALPVDYQANHKCEVRSCANPRHLYCGNQSTNMEDLWTRGAALDQGLLAMEVEAQISIRKAMSRPIPRYFRTQAKRLGMGRILNGYTGA